MIRSMKSGAVPTLMKSGTEELSGLQEAVIKNLNAGKELADVSRTSYGPNGMNKMIINHLDKLFVTSDSATILREMEVQHPAAKMIVMAAQMQEYEIGDGSNFVVCLAGELLAKAEELVRLGLHPSEIVAGYNKAAKFVHTLLNDLVVWTIESKDMKDKATVAKAINSAIAAKQFGVEDFLAPLCAEACIAVIPKNMQSFNVDNVRVVKVGGGNLHQSEVIKGAVVLHDSVGSIKKVKDAKIAVFAGSLEGASTETKGTILLENAEELLQYSNSEEAEIEKLIKAVADSGVKVVVTGGSIDDMSAHFLEKYGLMAVKVTSKHDLRRLCRAVKATPIMALGPCPPEQQGFASSVFVRELGSKKITIFQQDKADSAPLVTVLLRASTETLLNDLERAVDDGVNVVKAMGKDGRFLPGGGAVDIEVSRQLQQFAAKSAGLDQYAIAKFAEALEIIPRTLAENAGLPGIEVLSQLYAAHEKAGGAVMGINVEDGGLKDCLKANIFDLLSAKQQAFKLAVDAAVTILQVDQIISMKPAGGPKTGKQGGHWDDNE